MTDAAALPPAAQLPELADVGWRERVDERALGRLDRRWTLTTAAHQVPFLATAIGMPLLSPILTPMSLGALAFAWLIPGLYAARGAGVLRPPRPVRRGPGGQGPGGQGPGGQGQGGQGQGGRGQDLAGAPPGAELRALGLLGDLVGHDARELLGSTGLALERGALGVWLVASAGALLVRPGGRRLQCYCVRVTGDDLPVADRIAHLLLALRADEAGFATVANMSFSGACWRVRRKLSADARVGLAAAVAAAR